MNENLAKALAAAQSEMRNATLNKVNPHFRSKYADLAAIRDTTVPVLSKHGLSIVQFTRLSDAGLVLVTRLMHEGGEHIEGEYPLPMATDKPQQMGSALTYARRYCWSAMVGISADEDDDANSASTPQQQAAPPQLITASQAAHLRERMEAAAVEEERFNRGYSIAAVEELPASRFQHACNALDKAKARKEQAA
jgi:hypothetical protein